MALAVKRAGAISVSVRVPAARKVPPRESSSVAGPSASSAGTSRLTCPGETWKRGTGNSLSEASRSRSETPARVSGRGVEVAASTAWLSSRPNAAAMESGARGRAAKSAAETVAREVLPVTSCRTSTRNCGKKA